MTLGVTRAPGGVQNVAWLLKVSPDPSLKDKSFLQGQGAACPCRHRAHGHTGMSCSCFGRSLVPLGPWNSAGNAPGSTGIQSEVGNVPSPWPWLVGAPLEVTEVTPVGAQLGCSLHQGTGVQLLLPFLRGSDPAALPAGFSSCCPSWQPQTHSWEQARSRLGPGWVQAGSWWCLQTFPCDTTHPGSSLHPHCGAIWKLHFVWKWTLNTTEIFLMPFLSPFEFSVCQEL